MNYTKAVFQVDGLDGRFEGWTNGKTWNGWETPSFEQDELNRIFKECEKEGYRIENGKLYYEDETEEELIEKHTIEVDGKTVEVYAVSGWTWSKDK